MSPAGRDLCYPPIASIVIDEPETELEPCLAYIVPWLFVVVPGLYLVRFLWRRRGRRNGGK
jgi:hypothetical protein